MHSSEDKFDAFIKGVGRLHELLYSTPFISVEKVIDDSRCIFEEGLITQSPSPPSIEIFVNIQKSGT